MYAGFLGKGDPGHSHLYLVSTSQTVIELDLFIEMERAFVMVGMSIKGTCDMWNEAFTYRTFEHYYESVVVGKGEEAVSLGEDMEDVGEASGSLPVVDGRPSIVRTTLADAWYMYMALAWLSEDRDACLRLNVQDLLTSSTMDNFLETELLPYFRHRLMRWISHHCKRHPFCSQGLNMDGCTATANRTCGSWDTLPGDELRIPEHPQGCVKVGCTRNTCGGSPFCRGHIGDRGCRREPLRGDPMVMLMRAKNVDKKKTRRDTQPSPPTSTTTATTTTSITTSSASVVVGTSSSVDAVALGASTTAAITTTTTGTAPKATATTTRMYSRTGVEKEASEPTTKKVRGEDSNKRHWYLVGSIMGRRECGRATPLVDSEGEIPREGVVHPPLLLLPPLRQLPQLRSALFQ